LQKAKQSRLTLKMSVFDSFPAHFRKQNKGVWRSNCPFSFTLLRITSGSKTNPFAAQITRLTLKLPVSQGFWRSLRKRSRP
jgi:hypothetical protein